MGGVARQRVIGDVQKHNGAFYTDRAIAEFLVWWAIRSPSDTVLDPCFGEGVFVGAACERIRRDGGDPGAQIVGVERDIGAYRKASDALAQRYRLNRVRLFRADFFELTPTVVGQVDCVVGNPPFIRYQRFIGEDRARALRRSAEAGVALSRLCSSWAPFLIHAAEFIRPGGRLAMVAPAEIGYAAYARPVLAYLNNNFGSVTFLTFKKPLFPELSEETLLVLAEGRADGPGAFRWRNFEDAGVLAPLTAGSPGKGLRPRRLNAPDLARGRTRLIESFIVPAARDLYRELVASKNVVCLGAVADVGIGYVTGNNDFFHLTRDAIVKWDIPSELVLPSARRGSDLVGTRYTRADWEKGVARGEARYLLTIPASAVLPASVRRYIKHGEQRGVHLAYKCSVRSPWYAIPYVRKPDAFLSYMSGDAPRLVANEAGAVAPNTLHILRLHDHVRQTGLDIAISWLSSLARLSAELEGHSLGGGMLKLEPTEAERVALPVLSMPRGGLTGYAYEADRLCRLQRIDDARQLVDEMILRGGLGLSRRDCCLLARAADTLRDRRYRRAS